MNVLFSVLTFGEQARAFNDNLHVEFLPRQRSGVAFAHVLNSLIAHDQILTVGLYVVLKPSVYAVVLQQVYSVFNRHNVVNGDYLEGGFIRHYLESSSSDPDSGRAWGMGRCA